MTIDPTRSLDIRARAAARAAEPTDRDQKAQADAKSGNRADQVDISDAARALAREGEADGIPVALARLAEVQERLDGGFYELPDTIADVARRLLDSGDL
jgi:anti-sigma28 factor (negative regulator of flagellin synthesis)